MSFCCLMVVVVVPFAIFSGALQACAYGGERADRTAGQFLAQRRSLNVFRGRFAARRRCAMQQAQPMATAPQVAEAENWQSLFDGKTLDGWNRTNFGGEGEVTVEDGKIIMDFGTSLTGIGYEGELPKMNYEIRLEAMRLDGIDFFCGLTFPVRDSHCSFIVGGWAGSVVGLSCIDGRDASENDTTRYIAPKDNRWYRIRVRVTEKKIEAWLNDDQVVDQNIVGRRISLRSEVEPSAPLGIAAWETKAALRNIEIRRLAERDEDGAKE